MEVKNELYEYAPKDYRQKLTAADKTLWVSYTPMGSTDRYMEKLDPGGDSWKEGTHDLIGVYRSKKDAAAGKNPLPYVELKSQQDDPVVSIMKQIYREVKDTLDKPFETWNQQDLSRQLLTAYEHSFRPLNDFLLASLRWTFMHTLTEWTMDSDKYSKDGDIEFQAKQLLKEKLYRSFPHHFDTWATLLNYQTSSILEAHYSAVFRSHGLPGFSGVSLYIDGMERHMLPQLERDIVSCMLDRIDCYNISNSLKIPDTNDQSSVRRRHLNVQKDALEAFFADESDRLADDMGCYFCNCEFLAEYRACILLNLKIWIECLG